MTVQQATLNRIWTSTLMEELSRHGITHVCVAPGSRSTPLTLEAANHPGLTIHTHYDERGLGFLALGIAKASAQAVAVIVTSGTAVANLLPAVAEASLTGERLILLTADRPIDLISCGANQAIIQQNLFGHHVTDSLMLPSPTTQISLNWLLSSVDNLLAKQALLGGGVHINCPFPEPLYGEVVVNGFEHYTATIERWRNSDAIYCHRQWHNRFNIEALPPWHALQDYRGVVIIGNLNKLDAAAAHNLGQKLGWPILCDPQSGVSDKWQHYDLWLQNKHANQALSQANYILQFGSQLVSKRLLSWIRQQALSDCVYQLVSTSSQNLNPDHLPQIHWQLSAQEFASVYEDCVPSSNNQGWADTLAQAALATRACYQTSELITEIDVALSVEKLPAATQLFIGNSMIVRLVDMLAKVPQLSVFSNRGASGIDGLIATAAGVTRAMPAPTVVYLGDTSLLYDLNSLALFRQQDTPTVIVVTNNNGGAIFDMLPVPAEHQSPFYQMPHHLKFNHAAAQFDLAYASPNSSAELQHLLQQHLTCGHGTLLIEVVTPADQISQLIKSISSQIKTTSDLC